ncbi:hypothetical protein R6Q59_002197 [Mikania micrantha]
MGINLSRFHLSPCTTLVVVSGALETQGAAAALLRRAVTARQPTPSGDGKGKHLLWSSIHLDLTMMVVASCHCYLRNPTVPVTKPSRKEAPTEPAAKVLLELRIRTSHDHHNFEDTDRLWICVSSLSNDLRS